jgi:ABC-type nickel/cobalt efflux system permease component RcnA
VPPKSQGERELVPRAWPIALVFLCASVAAAHQLHVEAKVQGAELVAEVYFSSGTPPQGAKVGVVLLGSGEEVAVGLTDTMGTFRCRLAATGRYRLTVTDPGLHRASVEFDVSSADLAPLTSSSSPSPRSHGSEPHPSQHGHEHEHGHGHEHAPKRGQVPWGRLLLGLAIIGLLSGGLAWMRHRPEP